MKKIDIETWARRSHFEWFSAFADPTFAMNVRMDITNLFAFCKQTRHSSFATVMYIACACLNMIPAFRLRTLAGEVVELDSANVAYTAMSRTGNFVNCRASLAAVAPLFSTVLTLRPENPRALSAQALRF